MNAHNVVHAVNPATEEINGTYELHSPQHVEQALAASAAYRDWRRTPFSLRADLMRRAASILRDRKSKLATIITSEMGKPIAEAEAEVEKCAWCCDHYAENAERYLSDEPRVSNASRSYIQFTPLGTILAVMPWNFPFWQVFRFAAPALMAGNTGILKHASNVPGCSLAIEEIFREAGFPEGVFRSVLVPGSLAAFLIRDPRIAAVTLTGSEQAGSEVAALAGRELKKTVLELGGSDPFIVLGDADVDLAAATAVRARYQNAGQSCIAAKRFILLEKVADAFEERFVEAARSLKTGDPMDRSTQIGPLARADLREALDLQVRESVRQGARLLLGGRSRPGRGYYYEPTVLADVHPAMPVFCEEVFGPVAAFIRAKDPEDAVRIANDSAYGLGASVWTRDLDLAQRLAREIESGSVFVNGMVVSDPRLPFGGIKRSGYGRELSEFGIREFVNIQTVWVGPAR
ncbi:MAG: NAD-dependent succinate-semialdehyde dehydrogenase [Acidobacteria bacterium]|nr:NAD-dependent succinate-semialdehyde dehydrogenase [Acidobacteriota bacterium]